MEDIEEINIQRCRLCAEEVNSFVNVLETLNLVEEIYQHTSIMIKDDDDFPTTICLDCNYNISAICEFRERCLATQEIFEEITQEKEELYLNDEGFSLTDFVEAERDEKVESDKEISEYLLEITEDKCEMQNKDQNKKNSNNTKIRSGKKSASDIYKSLLRSCDMCGKMIERSRMRDHINRHIGVKPYTCDIPECRKSFYSPYNLRDHMRDFHSSTSFECDICGKSYNVRKSLYNHKMKHKTPNHICHICDRRYKNSTYLKQHMRTHTGERPYNCQYCSRSFASNYNLKAHIRSHTKEKPFKCKFCDAAYGYNHLLKFHIQKRHSDAGVNGNLNDVNA